MRIQAQERVRACHRARTIHTIQRINRIKPVDEVNSADIHLEDFGERFICSKIAEDIFNFLVFVIGPLYVAWLILQLVAFIKTI